MRSLSGLGLGLSLVFGCLLLALFAELYYLLWWKKRFTNRDMEGHHYNSQAREVFYMSCWKKPTLSSAALNPQQLCSSVGVTDTNVHEPQSQLQLHINKDLWARPLGADGGETELMKLQNLSGPPRFLFTIKEETKEDLESEDGRSRGDRSRKGSKGKSLSDLLITVETPFLTPLASPSFFTPPLTPVGSTYSRNGFSPLFESSTDAEFNSRIRASPPPKFKFLRDAEVKHHRKKLMEEAKKGVHNINDINDIDDDAAQADGVKAPSTSMFPNNEGIGPSVILNVAN